MTVIVFSSRYVNSLIIEKYLGQLRNYKFLFSGWHTCSECNKTSKFLCLCCPTGICRFCIRTASFAIVKGNLGFCSTCLELAICIEENAELNTAGVCVISYLSLAVMLYKLPAYDNPTCIILWDLAVSICFKSGIHTKFDNLSRGFETNQNRSLKEGAQGQG